MWYVTRLFTFRPCIIKVSTFNKSLTNQYFKHHNHITHIHICLSPRPEGKRRLLKHGYESWLDRVMNLWNGNVWAPHVSVKVIGIAQLCRWAAQLPQYIFNQNLRRIFFFFLNYCLYHISYFVLLRLLIKVQIYEIIFNLKLFFSMLCYLFPLFWKVEWKKKKGGITH